MNARAVALVALAAVVVAGAAGALLSNGGEEPDGAQFSYNYSTLNATVNAPMPDLVPTVTYDSYSINYALPAGLSFDPETGVISGVPSETKNTTNYTVTAHAGGVTHTATLKIAVLSSTAKSYYAVAGKALPDVKTRYSDVDAVYRVYTKSLDGLKETRSYDDTCDGYRSGGVGTAYNGMRATFTGGTTPYFYLSGTPASGGETDVIVAFLKSSSGSAMRIVMFWVVVDEPLAYTGGMQDATTTESVTARLGSAAALRFSAPVTVTGSARAWLTSYNSTSYYNTVYGSSYPPDDPRWTSMTDAVRYYSDGSDEVYVLVNGDAAYSTNISGNRPYNGLNFKYDWFKLRLSLETGFDPEYTIASDCKTSNTLTVDAYIQLGERAISASQAAYDFYVNASGSSWDALALSSDYSGATWAVSSGGGGFSLSSDGDVTPSSAPVSAGEYESQVTCTSPSDPTNVATVPLAVHVAPDLVFIGDPAADGVSAPA